MLKITLHSSGMPYEVGEHAYFMDYPERDIQQRFDPTENRLVTVTNSVLAVHFNNALAPVLLEMDGRPVRDSVKAMPKVRGHREYGGLETSLRFLRRQHRDRMDGIRVGELLLEWAEGKEHAVWSVSAPDGEAEVLRARSLGEHVAMSQEDVREPLRLAVVEFGGVLREEVVPSRLDEAPRDLEHDPDQCPLRGSTDGDGKRILCHSCDAVTDRDLQPDTRTPGGGGGGSKAKAKPKPASQGGQPSGAADEKDDPGRSAFVACRTTDEAKSYFRLRHDGTRYYGRAPGQVLSRAAEARAAGADADEIDKALLTVIERHKARQKAAKDSAA